MRVTFLTAVLATSLTAAAAAQDTTTAPAPASNISVEAVLTSAVVDRAPQDTITTVSISTEADTVYLWTRVSGAEPGTVVRHVWFRGDEEVGNVELTINGSPWRTWSRKTITADATGDWRVEVRDEAGNVLQTVSFTVGAAPAQ
jgi:Cu/Zn superoxide dismutase